MAKSVPALLVLALLLLPAECGRKAPGYRDGDLVFQVSLSSQSRAIQRATDSPWSHMSILFRHPGSGEWEVLEAVAPVVRAGSLEEWIGRGEGHRYAVKRLRDPSVLTGETLARMWDIGRRFLGRPYDPYFSWRDDALYCSELVWKVYEEGAGIEIGRRQELRELDVEDPLVAPSLRERYGEEIPWDESVISPGAMFDSERLVTVESR